METKTELHPVVETTLDMVRGWKTTGPDTMDVWRLGYVQGRVAAIVTWMDDVPGWQKEYLANVTFAKLVRRMSGV